MFLDAGGVITTVAGNGSSTLSGDGGPATSAGLSVRGVAVDGQGNIFISDSVNHRIRKVDTSGTITTVAGTTGGYSGDGGPATSAQLLGPQGVTVDAYGNLYIVDYYRIRWVDSSGTIRTVAGTGPGVYSGDGGPAIDAGLAFPTGIAMFPQNYVFITDSNTGNHRIRRIEPAGTGTMTLNLTSP